MSELRRDPFTGRWVVIAEGRGARPNEHAGRPPAAAADPDCPFCAGHEDRTPPETAALRTPGSPANAGGWTARAIPNKFPTLGSARSVPVGIAPPPGGDALEGAGIHEVVIENPDHSPGLAGLPRSARRALFRFFRERVRSIEADPTIASVLLFENWGPESGGTLWHPHAQIAGFPLVPARIAEEERRFAAGDGCALERATEAERAAGRRVLVDDPRITIVAPFGSEHPYELRIVPRTHRPSFASASDDEIDRLADLLPEALAALLQVQPGASYNWFVHGAGRATPASFHWHIEVVPRLVRPDGFELGSDLMVNPVPPERAAAELTASLEKRPGEKPRKR
ncbi:MAG TPA: DUF4931 domain-containing protein [Thermoplasmata archaeon]|nr:DUF4931 domain-containing protein [Thermoplasmata archaeon]